MSDVPKVLQKYGKGSLSDLIAYFDQELIFLDQARKELVDKDRLVQGLMLSLQDQEKKTKELGEKIKGMVTKEWKEQAVAKVKIECQQMIDQKIADWTNEKTDLVKKITVYEEKYGVLQSDEDGNTIIVEPTVEPIPFFLLRFLDWLKGKIL